MAGKKTRLDWLTKTGHTIPDIARKSGVDYTTVWNIFDKNTRMPRKPYRKMLLAAFPDFPISE